VVVLDQVLALLEVREARDDFLPRLPLQLRESREPLRFERQVALSRLSELRVLATELRDDIVLERSLTDMSEYDDMLEQ